jgi:hypothetical protein
MNDRNIFKVAALSLVLLVSATASAQTTTTPKPPLPPPSGSTTVVTNAEGKDFSLQLAMAELAQQGIKHPTRKQIEAARRSIQERRSQGEGWGVIAHSLGLNFGKVVSASNHREHDSMHDGKRSEKGEHKESKGGLALASNRSTEGSGGAASHGEHSGQSSGGGGGGGGSGRSK